MAERRSWLKWVGLGCGGLLLAIVAFILVTVFAVRSMTAGPEQVVKDFLAATAAGDYARAHDFFSTPLKQSQPLDQFIASVKSTPSLFEVTDTTFSERSIDLSGAKLAGTLTLRAGTRMPASFTLVQENDAWKLLAYHIGATP